MCVCECVNKILIHEGNSFMGLKVQASRMWRPTHVWVDFAGFSGVIGHHLAAHKEPNGPRCSAAHNTFITF